MLTLGFTLSLIATAPTAPAPSLARTAPTCAEEGATTPDIGIDDDGAPLTESVAAPAAARDYATPAVIDCRLPVVSRALQALVGECAGVTVPDASYRTSRWPESESPAGSLAPVRPDAAAKLRLTVVAGVPSQPSTMLAPPSAPPAALFAAPDFPRPAASPLFDSNESAPRSALGRRLERPPRA